VPCIAANDARCKYLFDNRYGTGQSSVNAVLDRTNLLMADKDVVVVGYGWVGKGIAARLRGLAARVTVCEVEPFAALEAYHDGFDVLPLVDACRSADLVISGTGVISGPVAGEIQDVTVSAGTVVTYEPNDLHGMRAPHGPFVVLAAITPRPGGRTSAAA